MQLLELSPMVKLVLKQNFRAHVFQVVWNSRLLVTFKISTKILIFDGNKTYNILTYTLHT